MNKMIKGVGITVKQGNTILVIKRKDNGQWGLPGGKVENGETLEEAAIRELYEEVGIKARSLIFTGYSFCPALEDKVESTDGVSAGFLLEIPKTTILPFVSYQVEEIDDYAWISVYDYIVSKNKYVSSVYTLELLYSNEPYRQN